MRLSSILKLKGMFSKDIRIRLANNQISLNGDAIGEDMEIDVTEFETWKEFEDSGSVLEIGCFLFSLMNNNDWFLRLKLFGLEELSSSNMENDLTRFLKGFIIVRISKKEVFVIKLNEGNV